MSATSIDRCTTSRPIRWGFVGTGTIATSMARVLQIVPSATLGAVASRQMDTAQAFAAQHGADRAFDSWERMLAHDDIDAVYVATPTSLREAICVAAASAGKHVLGEKPFASLPSLRRITAACRRHEVAFMDATHFVHHPRCVAIRESSSTYVGAPRLLDSRFLITLGDRGDIRYNPSLEPLGALGDLGWYNMRATLEYLQPGARLCDASARLQQDKDTGAIVAGEGSLRFDDASQSTWRCSFDAAPVNIGLDLAGPRGRVRMDNFIGDEEDGSATYRYTASDESNTPNKIEHVASRHRGPALMFENFAAVALNASLRRYWMQVTERTQALLDAVLNSAENPGRP